MFRDFDEFGRPYRRRPTQTIDIPRRNGTVRQPRDFREAYWLLQQELEQAKAEAAKWQTHANQLETAVQQQKRQLSQQEQALTAAQAKIAALKAKLAKETIAEEDDRNEWQEKCTRLYAEFENSKKRLEQRYAHAAETEKENILRDMLPLADNLERALAHAHHEEDAAGMALTLKAFTAVLEQYGIQSITDEGKPFDPAFHEAVGVVVHPEKEPGTILAVDQKGYLLHDKLLRPARVLVVAE